MSKSKLLITSPIVGHQRESSSSQPNQHWSNSVREVLVSQSTADPSALLLLGGSENGQFCWVGEVDASRLEYQDQSRLNAGDIVLEVQGHCIAGYTLTDGLEWISYVARNGNPVKFKTVAPDVLIKDLREFLNMRFQKGSIDHELQQLIRTNIYKRTVPCTTRPPRPGEVDGVDYRFLTVEQFKRLEACGELLESGIFDDNHYGTPKPPKIQPEISVSAASSESTFHRASSFGNIAMSGQHPSSDGKRQRNHSNIEINQKAPSSKSLEMLDIGSMQLEGSSGMQWKNSIEQMHNGSNVQQNSGNRPETPKQKGSALQTGADDAEDTDEVPYGWEKVDDPKYGIYYIDHINKRTQYENPASKFKKVPSGSMKNVLDSPQSDRDDCKSPPAYGALRRNFFTRNPNELQGNFISATLIKSAKGFGFTIVGGDDEDYGLEEFLQIKSISTSGPAGLDGKLQRSDVLVFVDGTCVLGFTHQDIIGLFQSIPVGKMVTIDVCRGYPLPFDPDDPNNEIITTVAVTATAEPVGNSSVRQSNDEMSSIKFLSMDIAKGPMGFGFTIADTAYGQCIKQIFDRSRCKGLAEGDLLVEINRTVVSDKSHLEVVEVLKGCLVGSTVTFLVQRGGLVPRNLKKIAGRSTVSPEPRREASRPLSETFDSPAASDVSGKLSSVVNRHDPSTKPIVLPKPSRSSMNIGLLTSSSAQQPDPRLNSQSSPFDREPSINPPVNKLLGLQSAKQQSLDSYEGPRRPVQRGASLRGEALRQETLDERFDGQYSNRIPGYARADMNSPLDSQNFTSQSGFSEVGNGIANRQGPARTRSKTPGPEFMRGVRSDAFDKASSDDYMQQSSLHLRRDPRSRTPTQEIPRPRISSSSRAAVSGTPDFIPASHYIPQPSPRLADQRMNLVGSVIQSPASSVSSADVNAIYGRRYGDAGPIPAYRRSEPQMRIPSNMEPYSSGVPSWSSSKQSGMIADEQYYEMPVYLQRLQTGFGFRIIGGTEEGSQVSVGHVVPGGAADIDGHLRPGDEITCVDGMEIIGASHREVVRLMSEAAQNGCVTLRIRRRTGLRTDARDFNASASMTNFNYPYDVMLKKREYESFGFVLVSSMTRSGSVIGSIAEASPAGRSAVLHVGDRIMAVNGVNVSQLHHEHIVNMIRDSGCSVLLTIGPPEEVSSTPASTVKQYPSTQLSSYGVNSFTSQSDSDTSPQRSDFSPYHSSSVPPGSPPDSSLTSLKSMNGSNGKTLTYEPNAVDSGSRVSAVGNTGDRFLTVELQRGARGFGFSIRGGREFNNMPLFVLKIADGGAAYVDGRLRVGDQILEVNGHSTLNITHAEAIELIQSGHSSVRLVVKRKPVVRTAQPHWAQPSKAVSYRDNGEEENASDLTPNGGHQFKESRINLPPSMSRSGYGQYQASHR